ncbi:MAG: glycosyltransferase [Desulfobacterota bacterium]|jgi:GT2 family glycosyltransferase|nr:glycosyltransferase [Thermodesulfobacteriota bacterium]
MTAPALPAVSVVICTLNREESLIRVLRLLRDQTVRPLEVLVIDQSTRPVPKFLAYLRNERQDTRRLTLAPPSTTAARNLSIREVRGEVVLYLDDDVLFHPELIERHLQNFSDPTVGAVSGKVMYDGAEENDEPWAARLTASGAYLRNFTTTWRGEVPTLYGCNMSIRTRVLREVGDFDLNYWGNFLWEEVDYALKIREKGYRIHYEPRAAVFHVMVKRGGSREPLPKAYLESTVFNDWYFFFKHIARGYWPCLLYRQKRVWLAYGRLNRLNLLPLLKQIRAARSKALPAG